MELTDEEFELLVEEAIESIPEGFSHYMKDLAVDIEDEPDDATCQEIQLRDRRSLFGLYRGVPLNRRHVDDPFRYPERIIIYQKNIERICRSKRQIVQQIRKTVLHEVGHHFGLTERHLRELGYG